MGELANPKTLRELLPENVPEFATAKLEFTSGGW